MRLGTAGRGSDYKGMPEEAIIAFENSYRINPNHGPTIANLAVLLENLNPKKSGETSHRGHRYTGEIPQLIEIAGSFEAEISSFRRSQERQMMRILPFLKVEKW